MQSAFGVLSTFLAGISPNKKAICFDFMAAGQTLKCIFGFDTTLLEPHGFSLNDGTELGGVAACVCEGGARTIFATLGFMMKSVSSDDSESVEQALK